MRIDLVIIDLLFNEDGATADELASVTDAWKEQVEHLMKKNEIERYMDEGEMRFKWIRRTKAEGEFRHSKKRAGKRSIAIEKEKQIAFELKSVIDEYWQVESE